MVLVIYAWSGLDEHESGVMNNRPEERKRLVKNALEEGGFESVAVKSPEPDLNLAKVVHSADMIAFLEHAWDRWVVLYQGTENEKRTYLDPFGVKTDDCVSVPSLVPCYVAPRDGLQRASQTVIGALAMYALDRETPITSSTRGQLQFDLAIVRECVARVCHYFLASPRKVTHPGHHAGKDFFGGFCFLNNVAIFAQEIHNKTKKKIAVLDVDYHAGNGTMSIFYDNPDICFVSIHADPETEYPFNSGFADQTGVGRGLGTTLNIPLPKGTKWNQYEKSVEIALRKLEEFGTEVLVISLGLDTLKNDPVAFPTASFELEASDFSLLGSMVLNHRAFEFVPKVVFQEGGYLLNEVRAGVLNFFSAEIKKAVAKK